MKWCEFFLYNTIQYLNINTILGHLLLSVLSAFDAAGCILFYWDFLRDKLKLNFKVAEARNTQRFNGQQSFCSAFTVVKRVLILHKLRNSIFIYFVLFLYVKQNIHPTHIFQTATQALNSMFLATTLRTRL